jgi:ferritin
MNAKMEKAFNDQINAEFYSSYYYMAMSAYCESIDLPGFAAWMMAQAEEEHLHAMRLYQFLIDRDGKPEFGAIEAPKNDFKSILDMFEHVLKHEQHVTENISAMYKLATEEADYPSQIELQWFISEQVEEEKTAKDIIQQLRWIGNEQAALYMLDQKMSERSGTAANTTE